eukprot:TRINITY_DN14707_c0_g1_i1.p3 TRINITY_DN14707_c0_g1~~TRINITY_DN14707_c0_g1_i1.p3  ORF type:complete len:182 (+),score=45.55 TRINITY_DN14707_c0_g1_i1:92-637(+)
MTGTAAQSSAGNVVAPAPLCRCITQQASAGLPDPSGFQCAEISGILSCKGKTGTQGPRPMPRICSSRDCSQLLTLPDDCSGACSVAELCSLASAGSRDALPLELCATEDARSPTRSADGWPREGEHADGLTDSPGSVGRPSPAPPCACRPLNTSLVSPTTRASVDVRRASEFGEELSMLRI